jgi:hypothetical protein
MTTSILLSSHEVITALSEVFDLPSGIRKMTLELDYRDVAIVKYECILKKKEVGALKRFSLGSNSIYKVVRVSAGDVNVSFDLRAGK